uniref:Uncharacterized protein n=1 Tax=uncultured organism MedDCM-OCT-S08-C288 TaxID=743637 RepID=D6PJ85_9ZZZZ|nr:hypothetical protein [uncultured organism MedDCM-OCT-S08-C288]
MKYEAVELYEPLAGGTEPRDPPPSPTSPAIVAGVGEVQGTAGEGQLLEHSGATTMPEILATPCDAKHDDVDPTPATRVKRDGNDRPPSPRNDVEWWYHDTKNGDEVCCVCRDGSSFASNKIVFCDNVDQCGVAVHQYACKTTVANLT